MPAISSYHRPATLDEALALLTRPGVVSRPIGGGTVIAAETPERPFEVVDLQALDLAGITAHDDEVVIGSMSRLQEIVDHPDVPPLFRDLAHREGPNTIRNAATLGGTVAAVDPESELLAGLLVHDAVVVVRRADGAVEAPLDVVLADPTILDGAVVTAVKVNVPGETAAERTGRTPADRPIVAVAGRLHNGKLRMAATGVATRPVLIDPEAVDGLEPPGDFRGSPEYRKALAGVLSARVVAALQGGSS